MKSALVFDHIGIAVATMKDAIATMRGQLPVIESTIIFDDEHLGVSVCFLRDAGGLVFECIAPLGAASPVNRVLDQKAGKLYQIAYRCEDIAASGMALRSAGALPLGAPKPAIAFGLAPVQFFYSRLGFLIELIEAPRWEHDFQPFT